MLMFSSITVFPVEAQEVCSDLEHPANFFCCSILTGGSTAWYGSFSAHNHKVLFRVAKTAELSTCNRLTTLQDIYRTWCLRKVHKITSDLSHSAHNLFSRLPSGNCFWNLSWTNRINSFTCRLSSF